MPIGFLANIFIARQRPSKNMYIVTLPCRCRLVVWNIIHAHEIKQIIIKTSLAKFDLKIRHIQRSVEFLRSIQYNSNNSGTNKINAMDFDTTLASFFTFYVACDKS